MAGVMQTETTRKRFTVDEYHRMGEAGILGPEDRVELIRGEILQMSPIGPRHMAALDRAAATLLPALKGRAIVSVGGAVVLDIYSEPQPDLVVLKSREDYYATRRREPGDVLFLLEVAHTSLRYDRAVKMPLYAISGIPEVWIEDLEDDQLLVHRDPDGDVYKTCLTLRSGDSVSPLAFPDLVLKIDDFLG